MKKKDQMMWLLILGGGAAAAWFFWQKKKKNDTAKAQIPAAPIKEPGGVAVNIPGVGKGTLSF